MREQEKVCRKCHVKVIIRESLPIPYQRCAPIDGSDCPLNLILQAIEEERARQRARKSSIFLG